MTLREPDDVEKDVIISDKGKTNAFLEARLCNFKTGFFNLWDSHKEWLNGDFQKVLQSIETPWVELYGYASVRGHGHFDNQTLSENRCKEVQKQIKQYSPNVEFDVFRIAKGDSWSDADYTKDKDSGYWRAVLIKLFTNKPTSPPVKVVTYRKTVETRETKHEPSEPGLGDGEWRFLQGAYKLGKDVGKGNFRIREHPLEKGDPDFGTEDTAARRTALIESQMVLTRVDVTTTVDKGPVERYVGFYTTSEIITREYSYSYGVGTPGQKVPVYRNGEKEMADPPSNLLDP
jgi:hypothetical protein